MEREPFILAELEDLSSILGPLKSTTRIKYTCFNVSANLLIMGASSGGLYVFRREPCVFLQLVPSKEGAVAQVAISPDERLLGVATVRGTVSLIERNQRGARVVASSYEHSGCSITALTWGGSELFIGDTNGKVSVLARTVFQPPAALLMQLDTKIVQLDARESLLVVSTMTRTYVCDTEREIYRQVGQKLRDGPFGGCFLSSNATDDFNEPEKGERARGAFSDGERSRLVENVGTNGKNSPDYSHLGHLRIFCARPGARIWEGDAEGTVLRTHNFKEALAIPPRHITSDRAMDNNNMPSFKINHQPVNFTRLFGILNRFLLTYTSDAVYVLDPERSDVVLWCDQIRDIIDVRVTDNIIYVWCSPGKMHALNLVPLEKFLIRMYFWKKYLIVAELCLEFSQYLQSHAPHSTKLHLLKDLDEKLQDESSPNILSALMPILEIFRSNAHHTQVENVRKLKSGIYQIMRPNFLNLKYRSHSVSPDRANKERGSTSSLPELVKEEDEVTIELVEEADKEIIREILQLCPRILGPCIKLEEVQELIMQILLLCDKENPLLFARTLPIRKIFPAEAVIAISKAFHSALTSGTLKELLKSIGEKTLQTKETETELHNGNEQRKVSYKIEQHPEFLATTIDQEFLTQDRKFSLVLRIFGDILDKDHILRHVKTAIPQCYYLSLLEILKKFETVGISLNDSLSPPRALSVVDFLLKVGQIDQICRWSHMLDFQDVTYLVMSREQEDGRSGKVLFLSLMDGWRAEGNIDLSQQQYLLHCLQALQHGGVCHCGFPVPEERKSERPRFYELGKQLLESKTDPSEAVRVCGVVPWLWPHLLEMRASDGLLKLLPLILHLGDLEELERRIPEMDSLLCEVLVRHLAGLHRGDCLNCGRRLPSCTPGITWTQVALLLVKAIGHSETLRLLTQYKADISGLEPVFHRAVVLAAIMEKHSTGLRHSVVDIFSGRTSQQTSLISPSLHVKLLPSTPITPGPSHWGLKLSGQAHCAACSILVSAKVLTDAGVVAFPCRHVFHAVCLRTRDACPVCCAVKKC